MPNAWPFLPSQGCVDQFAQWPESDSAALADVIEQIDAQGLPIDSVQVDQGVLSSFPELAPDPTLDGKSNIDLRHLLTMTS